MSKVKLKNTDIEIIDGDRGKNYPKEDELFSSGYCLFLDASNITKSGFDLSSLSFISQEKDKKLRSGKLERNDIILTTRGSVGNIALYDEHIPYDNIRINSGMLIIRPNQSFLPKYLKYMLGTKYIVKQIENYSSGSVQKQITVSILQELNLINRSLEEQQSITKVLSIIDDKIDLNNRINKELEQMAKTLYDYWFIQFEFPDGNGGAYKSSNGPMTYNEVLKREIPVGWEVKNVDELCDVITGKEDANFARSDGKYAFFTCGDDILKCDKAVFKGKSILIAGNGNFNVKYYEGEFNAYQRTYVLIPNDDIYIGVMYRAMLDSISRFTKGSNGSIVKFITKGDIANTKIIIPSNKELLTPLNNILSSIEKNKEQNQKLAEIRDFLLPMLMNGQVSIVQP